MRLARTHSAGHAPWMELSQAVMVARLDAYLAWGCSINDIAKVSGEAVARGGCLRAVRRADRVLIVALPLVPSSFLIVWDRASF